MSILLRKNAKKSLNSLIEERSIVKSVRPTSLNDVDEKVRLAEQYESNVRLYSRVFPEIFVRAQGSIIYGATGKRYLDFFSGAGAVNYGHNNKEIKQAVIDYLLEDNIIHALDMYTPVHIDFLLKFQNVILQPRKLDYKIQFTGPTGANAVEAALKLARTYTKRRNIIYFKNSYHGLSLGALSVSDLQHKREHTQVQFIDTTRLSYELKNTVDSQLIQYELFFSNMPATELPAAIILETIQGEGGVNEASLTWLKGVERLAQKFSILLIVDDIQTGCGRTGDFFSFEKMNMYPDIVCLSKSLSGLGLPLSAILIKPSLDVWEPGEHTGTFRSNNLALTSAIKALDFWQTSAFSQEIFKKSSVFIEYINQLIDDYPQYEMQIKGRGLMLGIEWLSSNKTAPLIARYAFEHGLIIETAGSDHQVLKILPALTISEAEIAEGMKIIKNSFEAILKR